METSTNKLLSDIVGRITQKGKGILAADESTNTIGKKFEKINLENNEQNRQRYREMLFSTPSIEQYISGIILHEETTKQSCKDGKKFIDVIKSKGIVVGVKVDEGLQDLVCCEDGEKVTAGLDNLVVKLKQLKQMGVQFTKLRCVYKIDLSKNWPSKQSMRINSWTLARYAKISQECGMVPIVEPEILSDGNHSIEDCRRVTQNVLVDLFEQLHFLNVFIEGTILKPNMVLPGSQNPGYDKCDHKVVGEKTLTALVRSVPISCRAIMFLSGGQSEEQAINNLNSINLQPIQNEFMNLTNPWFLSFSFGRALQNTAVQTWGGKDENVLKAQKDFINKAHASSQAQQGIFHHC